MIKTINKLIERNTKLEETMFEIFMTQAKEKESVWNLIDDFNNGEMDVESGCIPELTYYYQTEEIFKENFNEIFEEIEEYKVSCCVSNPIMELSANGLVWKVWDILSTRWINEIEDYYENGSYDGWEFVVEE